MPVTPPPSNWREVIQVIVSCGVSFGLARLGLFVGHLSPFQLAAIYVPLTGAYYAGVSELESRYPSWGWIFYLFPSQLPE